MMLELQTEVCDTTGYFKETSGTISAVFVETKTDVSS